MQAVQKYEGLIEALAPLHHGGNEKTGSTPVLRTIMMYDVNSDEIISMPYINGNAIRGKGRRGLMMDFVAQLGLSPDDLPVKLYHVMFSGGLLESTDDSASVIDLRLRRKIRQLLPPLSLLGCAIGNQMIQGKLKIGHAFPLCREYAPYLPDRFKHDPRIGRSVREYTDDAFDTRRDDLRAKRGSDQQAIQMRIEYECFVPGTAFYHWLALEYPQEIEAACLGRFVQLWADMPIMGGKSSSGNGQVRLKYEPDLLSPETYLTFLDDNKDDIVAAINELGEAL